MLLIAAPSNLAPALNELAFLLTGNPADRQTFREPLFQQLGSPLLWHVTCSGHVGQFARQVLLAGYDFKLDPTQLPQAVVADMDSELVQQGIEAVLSKQVLIAETDDPEAQLKEWGIWYTQQVQDDAKQRITDGNYETKAELKIDCQTLWGEEPDYRLGLDNLLAWAQGELTNAE